MSQSHYELYYHLVWSTRDRYPFLDSRLQRNVRNLILEKAIGLGCRVYAVNCVQDHAHMVLWIPGNLAASNVVGQIKGYSSHELRARGCVDFRWQDGFGIFTMRKSDLPMMRHYVVNQEEHHRHDWNWRKEDVEEIPPIRGEWPKMGMETGNDTTFDPCSRPEGLR